MINEEEIIELLDEKLPELDVEVDQDWLLELCQEVSRRAALEAFNDVTLKLHQHGKYEHTDLYYFLERKMRELNGESGKIRT